MRYLFGRSPADYVVAIGDNGQAVFAEGATLEAWSAEEGGSQYTMYADEQGSTALDVWTTDSRGIPKSAYGPDGVVQVWLSANAGPRVLMSACDAISKLQDQVSNLIEMLGAPNGIATLNGDGVLTELQRPPAV